MSGCSSSNPRASDLIDLGDRDIGLFFKAPQAILARSQSWEPLLWCSEGRAASCLCVSSSEGTRADWISLHPLTARETPGCIFPALRLPLRSNTQVRTHTYTYMHVCLCAHTALHFIYAFVTSPFSSGLSSLSKLLWHLQPACNQRKTKRMSEGVVQLSQKKRDEELVSQTAGLFPWKVTAFEKCSASSFWGREEESEQASDPLLMALVSQVLYWKGQPSSRFKEGIVRKGVKINWAECYLISSSWQPFELSINLTLQMSTHPQRG